MGKVWGDAQPPAERYWPPERWQWWEYIWYPVKWWLDAHRLPSSWYEVRHWPGLLWEQVTRSLAYFRLAWWLNDDDWSSIARVMRYQIQRTRRVIESTRRHSHWERDVRQMLIAETVLQRMIDDDYYERADYRYPSRANDYGCGKFWSNHIKEAQEQDITLLFRSLRHLQSWWD